MHTRHDMPRYAVGLTGAGCVVMQGLYDFFSFYCFYEEQPSKRCVTRSPARVHDHNNAIFLIVELIEPMKLRNVMAILQNSSFSAKVWSKQ